MFERVPFRDKKGEGMSANRAKMTKREKHEMRVGLAVASPWIIGFTLFFFVPLIVSLGMSFTNYSFLGNLKFVGLKNYKTMFTDDPLIWKSLKITLSYAIIAVPGQLIFGFFLAILLNMKLKGMTIFRTIFYLPTIIVTVSMTLLWRQMLDTDFGVINYLLKMIGIGKVSWLSTTPNIIASLVIINLWGCGRSMIINLAGLQGVPTSLYEAARIDGANKWQQLKRITLPMLTPTIFLNLMTGMIGAFKMFTTVKILTDGGPNNASMFYMLYLYKNAFGNYRMGYACAMSWLLFIIVGAFTLLIFKSSSSWVHYDGGDM